MNTEYLEPLSVIPHYADRACESSDHLTNDLERDMFYTFFSDHFTDPHSGHLIHRDPVPMKKIQNTEDFNNLFRCSWDQPIMRKDYTYVSNIDTLPVLEEREAAYSIIFSDGDKVCMSVDNTYKYQEWDELLDEMTGNPDMICGRRGIHRAFIIYTDSSDTYPVWTLYDKTVAGFAVDNCQKRLACFGPESAVLIYHSLYLLCCSQYSCFFGQTNRSGTDHIHDDSKMNSSTDPFIKEFSRRFNRYLDRYDEQELIDIYTDDDWWN